PYVPVAKTSSTTANTAKTEPARNPFIEPLSPDHLAVAGFSIPPGRFPPPAGPRCLRHPVFRPPTPLRAAPLHPLRRCQRLCASFSAAQRSPPAVSCAPLLALRRPARAPSSTPLDTAAPFPRPPPGLLPRLFALPRFAPRVRPSPPAAA